MKDKRHLIKNRERRQRRRHRLRKIVSGTPERPRMVVHRSLRHIEVQLVDDVAGHSLLGFSTQSQDLKERAFDNRVEQGREVGKIVAAKAREKGIEQVVFDRGGFLYHGVIKAVADGAREAGLNF
ncbi:MAG: 50S ribosomal protein L18 [Candidatus Latescibacterota bacterium]|nr:50S ribosomal protein L18 [Candidatus Latescibacterota bacterium]